MEVWIAFWSRFWMFVIAAAILVGIVVGGWQAGWWFTVNNANRQQTLNQQISNRQAQFSITSKQAQIDNYNKFYKMYGDYQADLETVASNQQALAGFNKEYTAAQIAADPTGNLESLQQQDVAAVQASQQSCTRDATTYNNDSKEVQTGAEYKGVDLSQQVSVAACQNGDING